MSELDPRTALDQARKMTAYVHAFDDQKFDSIFDPVDRRHLAIALDHLEETAAMLLNMAERVAPMQPILYDCSHPSCGCEGGRCAADDANDATQPPQDERGQGRIPFAGYDPKFCPGSNPDNPQTEEAEPEQPVALSTLTDSEIVKQVKNSFDSYDHAEINRRELVQSIRAALSVTGSDESAKEAK